MRNKAFTLIELLVVIAIIGLIAAMVLVSTRGTRFKANDANIKSFMHQLRNAAEMSYSKYEDYDEVCTGSQELSSSGDFGLLKTAIEKENQGQEVKCIESADKKDFAASFPLRGQEGKHWCVESAGLSIELDHEITAAKCE